MSKYLVIISTSLFLLAGFFFYQNARFNDGRLHVIVCNVGQGDGILIRTPAGDDILVDGGPDDSILDCLSSHMPFWDRSIELMVLTHPHTDHAAGLVSVLKRYDVLHFVSEKVATETATYKRLQDELMAKRVNSQYLFSGDRIDFSDKTQLLTLWPAPNFSNSLLLQDENDSQSLDLNGFSLIQELRYGNFTMLLTGDAGYTAEDKIASQVQNVTVLKVPHHGSATGMSDYSLSEINPQIAVISVGARNTYGHPSVQALTLLKSHSVKALRTDKDGEVELITDGKTFGISSQVAE